MTLKEAKEILKNFLHWDNKKYPPQTECEAIETLLNYIENESIPKEKVREKIKSIEDVSGLTTYDEEKLNALYELLGD